VWVRFFSGLRYIVLDELHTYRGVFGSHVANVLRRVRRIARFYGAEPRLLAASATIANPQILAESLWEAPVVAIDADGAPYGERHILFYNPPLLNPTLGLRASASAEAVTLAIQLLRAGVQTILFAAPVSAWSCCCVICAPAPSKTVLIRTASRLPGRLLARRAPRHRARPA
jgi:DEAD/DEAH box helicase domain-containing protein